MRAEEAVAEAYRRWSENRLEIGVQVSWLFARIARLLEKIREAFRGAWTAEDVFRAIDHGEHCREKFFDSRNVPCAR